MNWSPPREFEVRQLLTHTVSEEAQVPMQSVTDMQEVLPMHVMTKAQQQLARHLPQLSVAMRAHWALLAPH